MDSPLAWARSRPISEPDWIAGPGIELVRRHPELIRRIRRSGTEVHVWTVNSRADLDLCLAQDVAAVITDRPGAMLGYLAT
jgi:glycerophosphoryl diester phosphodiesterase